MANNNTQLNTSTGLLMHLATLLDGDEAKPQIAIAYQLSCIKDELRAMREANKEWVENHG